VIKHLSIHPRSIHSEDCHHILCHDVKTMRVFYSIIRVVLLIRSSWTCAAVDIDYTTATSTCEELEPTNSWRDVTSMEECVEAHLYLFEGVPYKTNNVPGSRNSPCGCTRHKWGNIEFWGVAGDGCNPSLECTNWRGEGDQHCYCKPNVPTDSPTVAPSTSAMPSLSPYLSNYATSISTCDGLDPPNTWRDVESVVECLDAHVYTTNSQPKNAHDNSGMASAPCGCTYHAFNTLDFWGVEGSGCSTESQCTNFRGGDGDKYCYCTRIDPIEWEKCRHSDIDCHRERVQSCAEDIIADLSSGGCYRSGSTLDCIVPEERVDECGNLLQLDHVADRLGTNVEFRSVAFQGLALYREIFGAVFDVTRPKLQVWAKYCSGYKYLDGELWEPNVQWACSGCGCNNVLDKTIYFKGQSVDRFSGVCFDKKQKTSELAESARNCNAQGDNYVYRKFGTPANYAGSEIHRFFFSIQQAFFDYVLNPQSIAENPQWIDTYGQGWEAESKHFPGVANAPNNLATERVEVDITLGSGWGLPVAYVDYPMVVPTGLYLPPSSVATVTVPNVNGLGEFAKIIIGAHRIHKGRPGGVITRFDRISYDVALLPGSSMKLFNPFGGNIYFEIQHGANLGYTSFEFANVAKSPFFRHTENQITSCDAWDAATKDAGASVTPWTDIVTDESFLQVPTDSIRSMDCDRITKLAETWQKRVHDVSTLMGYRELRNRYVLSVQVDTRLKGGAGSIGEPMVNSAVNPYRNPMLNTGDWRLTDVLESTTMHELGHMQAFPNFHGEGESIVHLPYTYAANLAGYTLDKAFADSTNGDGLKDAVISWMVTEEFQTGLPMNIENNPKNQIRYQPRGHAKYIDLVSVFGWGHLIAYFHAHQLVYEAFNIHANPQDSLEEHKVQFYNTKWPWKKILEIMSKAASLEVVDWAKVATYFVGEADNEEDMMNKNVEVNIILLSLATDTNLLPYLDFWGVNGVDNDARTKINDIVGSLSTSSLCDLSINYESFIPQDQQDLTEHIQRLHSSYIKSVDANTYVIEWKPDVYYLDERYAAGYYAQHDLYDAEYETGIQNAQNRLSSLITASCSTTDPPTKSPSSLCSENANDVFFLKKDNKGEPLYKNCQWLSARKNKKKVCKRTVDYYDGYSPPQNVCVTTCNSCGPCFENKWSKFVIRNKNGKIKYKTCKWLGTRVSKCDKYLDSHGGYGPPKEVCPNTCSVSSCIS